MILLLIIFSCAKSDIEYESHYQSVSPTFIEKVNYTLKYGKFGKWTWTIGSKLTLNKDSTFYMTTCANHINGQWYSKSDTLFLRYQEMSYKIDSFNYVKEWKEKLDVKGKVTYYLKKGDYLERAYTDTQNRYMVIKLGVVKTGSNQ